MLKYPIYKVIFKETWMMEDIFLFFDEICNE